VGDDEIGHFHYKEKDEAAVGPVRDMLHEATEMADWWTKA
jgi:hypothetical protein